MREIRCYNCGGDQSSFYLRENGFFLVKCSGCGLLYVNPQPDDDEISLANQCGVHKGDDALNVTGKYNSAQRRSYVKILKNIFRNELKSDNRTWLDIGAGHGEFLKALSQVSEGRISSEGVEPNIHKQRAARKRGLNVSWFDINTHFKKYDFISLLNVYSHLPDPPAFLKACRNLLMGDGELLIRTGDAAHLSSHEMYRPLYLPDHLSFASEQIICDILEKSGFQVFSVFKRQLIPVGIKGVIRELIACVHPSKKSGLLKMFNPKFKTDMFIRARNII